MSKLYPPISVVNFLRDSGDGGGSRKQLHLLSKLSGLPCICLRTVDLVENNVPDSRTTGLVSWMNGREIMSQSRERLVWSRNVQRTAETTPSLGFCHGLPSRDFLSFFFCCLIQSANKRSYSCKSRLHPYTTLYFLICSV